MILLLLLKKLARLKPELLFHVIANLLGFLHHLFSFSLDTGTHTTRLALGHDLIFFHPPLAEGPEPIPDLIAYSILGAIRRISGHGKPTEHKCQHKEQHC